MNYTFHNNPNVFHIPETAPISVLQLSAVGFFQSLSGQLIPMVRQIGKMNTNSVDLAYVLDTYGLFSHKAYNQIVVDPIERGTFNPLFRRREIPDIAIRISQYLGHTYQADPTSCMTTLFGVPTIVHFVKSSRTVTSRPVLMA